MRKLKIYLDTSIINFVHAKDAPEYMKITNEFFNNYINEYDVYISEIVFLEISRTSDSNRKKLLYSVLEVFKLKVYNELTHEIEELSQKYISYNIIPKNKIDDALHVAFATYYEFDILLSWNFKHLANIKKQIEINSVNEREGYTKKLNLLNPFEVIYEK